jgi:hypothetical protein
MPSLCHHNVDTVYFPLYKYVTICLTVLRTITVSIHTSRLMCVLCSVHATYPAHPRRLHVSPEVHIFTAHLLCQPGSNVKSILFHFT